MSPTTASTAAALAAGEGEAARFFADEMLVKERRPELDLCVATVHAGCEPPLHVHHREDEWIVVLEGRVTAFADGRALELQAGAIARLPRAVPHTYAVDSGEARLLVINSPGGFAGMFADLERAFDGAMPPAPSPAHGALMAPVFEAYGIEMVGPNPRYA